MNRHYIVPIPPPPPALSTPSPPTRHQPPDRYYIGPLPTLSLGFYKSPSQQRPLHQPWYYFLSSPSPLRTSQRRQQQQQQQQQQTLSQSRQLGRQNRPSRWFRHALRSRSCFNSSSPIQRLNNHSDTSASHENINALPVTSSNVHQPTINEQQSSTHPISFDNSTSISSGSSSDHTSNGIHTPLLSDVHHTTLSSDRITRPVTPQTPVDSIRRIDSSIHPAPKRISSTVSHNQLGTSTMALPSTSAPVTTMTSPVEEYKSSQIVNTTNTKNEQFEQTKDRRLMAVHTNSMPLLQAPHETVHVTANQSTTPDLTTSPVITMPSSESLCHLMLLRVERVHPHNMPDIYHQGVALFTSLRSVQWRQVVGQLDGQSLSFHQPSSPSSSVPVSRLVFS
ncbi:hypothetical protein BDF19DRAFT_320107 [Syncephalis fuscata]|nr:hypothetical protein BDF19DRAFT_320107 [Syncephalis fuscata]